MQLARPVTINQLSIPNRIVFPAMVSRLASPDGTVTAALTRHLERITTGGPGLVIIEATAVVSHRSGQLLRLHDDAFIPGLRRLVSRLRAAGPSRIGIQLIHFLRLSRSGYRENIKDLDIASIDQLRDAFASATARARIAGVDCVEIHAAHAYTLASFLSKTNRRRDRYGGDVAGRSRIMVEVLAAIREQVGSNFAVGCRINGDDVIRGGNRIADAALIAARLADAGYDYISVSAGGRFEDAPVIDDLPSPYEGPSGHRAIPPASMPDCVNVPAAAAVRTAVRSVGTPVIAAGKISSVAACEQVLSSGAADLVALCRPLLCDPAWPDKALNGREHEIVPCRYCNACVDSDRSFEPVSCIRS